MSKNKNWKKEERKIRALTRQEEYNKLSPQERLTKLDLQNGVGIGAKKQREKIVSQIKEGSLPKRRKKSKNKGSITTTKKNLLKEEIE